MSMTQCALIPGLFFREVHRFGPGALCFSDVELEEDFGRLPRGRHVAMTFVGRHGLLMAQNEFHYAVAAQEVVLTGQVEGAVSQSRPLEGPLPNYEEPLSFFKTPALAAQRTLSTMPPYFLGFSAEEACIGFENVSMKQDLGPLRSSASLEALWLDFIGGSVMGEFLSSSTPQRRCRLKFAVSMGPADAAMCSADKPVFARAS